MARAQEQANQTLVLGLTGGIACGKSTVSRHLASLGAWIVDGDLVARDVVAPGQPGLAAIVHHFGEHLLLPDGTLDRAQLGRLIFADETHRLQLNALLHPLIAGRLAQLVDAARLEGVPVCVLDVPLLLEMDVPVACDVVWTVECPPGLQVERLVERNGLSVVEALRRVTSQWTSEQRIARADEVLDNSGTVAELVGRVDALWRQLPIHSPM